VCVHDTVTAHGGMVVSMLLLPRHLPTTNSVTNNIAHDIMYIFEVEYHHDHPDKIMYCVFLQGSQIASSIRFGTPNREFTAQDLEKVTSFIVELHHSNTPILTFGGYDRYFKDIAMASMTSNELKRQFLQACLAHIDIKLFYSARTGTECSLESMLRGCNIPTETAAPPDATREWYGGGSATNATAITEARCAAIGRLYNFFVERGYFFREVALKTKSVCKRVTIGLGRTDAMYSVSDSLHAIHKLSEPLPDFERWDNKVQDNELSQPPTADYHDPSTWTPRVPSSSVYFGAHNKRVCDADVGDVLAKKARIM
jgi:hypothetical protein